MMGQLYIVDDTIARGWAPLAVTRPAGEIVFGAISLRDRLERAIGHATVGYLAAPGLEGFARNGIPPVVDHSELPRDESIVLLSSRYVPPLSEPGIADLVLDAAVSEGGVRLVAGESHVGWILPRGPDLLAAEELTGDSFGPPDARDDVRNEDKESDWGLLEMPGRVLEAPWELVEQNPAQLAADLSTLYPEGAGEGARRLPQRPRVEVLGAEPVSAEEDVVVDPYVVLDTRTGPIHLGSGVRIRPFTHLRGPALIGAGSTLLGGTFEAVSCGPVCNLRGEISASILLGWTNKAHDGYLGHSLVGSWVNLGAMTTNSDLKNNYGSVRVATVDGELDTGLLKLGVFLGDHVNTGIGTTLSAGTTVGVGTNLFGGGAPPKLVPPFHWGDGHELIPHRLDAFLQTAQRAMDRRSVSFPIEERAFLTRVWRRVHGNEGAGTS